MTACLADANHDQTACGFRRFGGLLQFNPLPPVYPARHCVGGHLSSCITHKQPHCTCISCVKEGISVHCKAFNLDCLVPQDSDDEPISDVEFTPAARSVTRRRRRAVGRGAPARRRSVATAGEDCTGMALEYVCRAAAGGM